MDNIPNRPKRADTHTSKPQAQNEYRRPAYNEAPADPRGNRQPAQRPNPDSSRWNTQYPAANQQQVRARPSAQNPQRPMAYPDRPQRVDIPRTTSGPKPRPRPSRPTRKGGGSRGGDQQFPVWTIPIITICLGLLAVAGWFVQTEYARYDRYQSIRNKVSQNGFYQNTFVDGVDISGKTMAQAVAILEERTAQRSAAFAISVAYGQHAWRIDSSQVPVGANYESALRHAYAYGRSGSMQQRYMNVRAIETNGMSLTSEWGYDHIKLREITDQITAGIAKPAVDARLTSFDPNTKAFLSAPEETGVQADGNRLFADVSSALDNRQFDATIQVQTSQIEPNLRQSDIASLFGKISSYSTTTTNDDDRNTNISLAARAINGKVLLPGDTLSFNECTGQRTSAKGYREAGAIAGGQLIDATGGGVCQTSSTLFNAVVRADLEIVSRTQHTWPSTYVPRGEDAAVDWPRLDFKFRNNSDYPVFIVAWYDSNQMSVEIYGRLMAPGRTIDLASTTVKETRPSSEVIMTRSLDLPADTQKVAKKERTGYVVDTYKVYYQNGQEVERKKLWRTEYKPVQKEIYWN